MVNSSVFHGLELDQDVLRVFYLCYNNRIDSIPICLFLNCPFVYFKNVSGKYTRKCSTLAEPQSILSRGLKKARLVCFPRSFPFFFYFFLFISFIF